MLLCALPGCSEAGDTYIVTRVIDGDTIELKVYHDGEEKFVTAELGEFGVTE